MTIKSKSRTIGKKQIDQNARTNFHVHEYKNSKIYLSIAPTPGYAVSSQRDDIHILNQLFQNMFTAKNLDKPLDIAQRQQIILWGAEGVVILEGKNQTISKTVAKEVALALHLDLPVWVLRGYKLEPVQAIAKDWQGVKENEDKWATIITEGEELPRSNGETTHLSNFKKAPQIKLND